MLNQVLGRERSKPLLAYGALAAPIVSRQARALGAILVTLRLRYLRRNRAERRYVRGARSHAPGSS